MYPLFFVLILLNFKLKKKFHQNRHGSFGTTDRICNATSLGLDGCRYLCCGRGYRTIENDVDIKCNCKFVWCCQVKCDLCRQRIIEHRCN